MTFPQYAVSKWIGHSITVSGRHYANDVPDELFQRAAGPEQEAQQNRQLQPSETGENAPKAATSANSADDRISLGCENLQQLSVSLDSTRDWRRRESNPRPEAFQPGPLRV